MTPRELEVLRQLVKGQSNKEIGRELQLSEVTIGLRLRSIYRKLDVKSRTQAVRLALRQGLDGLGRRGWGRPAAIGWTKVQLCRCLPLSHNSPD